MPNVFKSGSTSTNGSIYKGQFTIGVDTSRDFGPTSATSFWNGIVPAASGYTIYQNKAANGPSIRTAANDSALVSILQSMGSTGSTAANVLDWASQQSSIMVANIDYPSIRMTTQIPYQTMLLDAGYVSSYPRQGTTWRDLGGFNQNVTLVNGPTFSSVDGGSIVFDGTNDSVTLSTTPLKLGTGAWSLSCWWKANGTQADFSSIMSLNFVASNISQGSWAFKVKNATAQNVFSFSYASALNTIVDVTSSAACNDGNWHNLVITRSGTSCIMYMDAVSVGTFTLPNNFNLTGTANANLGFTPRDNAYIKGNVAFCSINGFALTAEQVTSNFNALKGRFGL
jgi:hypothetical protein